MIRPEPEHFKNWILIRDPALDSGPPLNDFFTPRMSNETLFVVFLVIFEDIRDHVDTFGIPLGKPQKKFFC